MHPLFVAQICIKMSYIILHPAFGALAPTATVEYSFKLLYLIYYNLYHDYMESLIKYI